MYSDFYPDQTHGMVSGRDCLPHFLPQNPAWVHPSVHRKQLLQVLHLLQGSLYLEAKYAM